MDSIFSFSLQEQVSISGDDSNPDLMSQVEDGLVDEPLLKFEKTISGRLNDACRVICYIYFVDRLC